MPAAVASTTPQHAAGIFANRNLDGPEIGTLVVVIDRAKNLPNLRTMGKQNPYCAARLGKMALKTETDQRGGQTPKWDQELRFNVHESLDYQKLKVSVFNEDRKTDLVGETFIGLDDVLRRGGGQNDGWHELHNKGKYAGQIRIELTFYDSRPREEKRSQQDRRLSSNDHVNDSPAEPARHTAGPREPTSRRRPVSHPDQACSSQADFYEPLDSIPLPQQGPRSFHTPPRVGSMVDMHSTHQQQHTEDGAFAQSYGNQYAPAHTYPHPNDVEDSYPIHEEYGSETHYDQAHGDVADEGDGLFAYPDDPYALDAAHVGDDAECEPQQQPYTPYRPDRISQLSGVPRPMPPQSSAIPHVHSAPLILSQQRQQAARRAPNSRPVSSDVYGHSSSASYHQGFVPAQGLHQVHAHRNSAPPPPRHTNSAPEPQSVPHSVPFPYFSQEVTYPRSHESSYAQPVYPETPGHQQMQHDAMRRRSANAYETFQQPEGPPAPFEGAPEHEQYDPAFASPQPASHDRISRAEHPFPGYQNASAHDQAPHHVSTAHGPTIVKPRAISPNRPQPRQPQAISRKSVNSSPPGAPNQPSSVPFSPDSFDAFNPSVKQGSSPAFSPQRSSPLVSSLSATPADRAQVPETDGSIRDAHGRLVDPSDHLPASTHAPEPEKKGADKHRATITATVKTRFGPREARPAHVVATRTSHYVTPSQSPSGLSSPATSSAPQSAAPSPLQQREAMAAAARHRLQKRSPGAGGSSPLAPSGPGALNQSSPVSPRNPYHYGQAGGPPVPMKIPLDQAYPHGQAFESGTEPSYGARDALSQEIAKIDIGPSPLQTLEMRYGGNGGQRTRRSRFGA